MTRIDSVRAATGSAKDSVLHAADVVAPYADTAKDRASLLRDTRHAYGSRRRCRRLRNRPVSSTAHISRRAFEQARTHVPPKVDHAAHEAAVRTAQGRRQAADYTGPRIEQAVAAAGPVRRGGRRTRCRRAGRAARPGHAQGDPEAGPQARAAGPGGPARQGAGGRGLWRGAPSPPGAKRSTSTTTAAATAIM